MKSRGFLAILVLTAMLTACSLSNPKQDVQPVTDKTPVDEGNWVVKGFGISPQGFPLDYRGFAEFLEEISSLPNSGVMFNGAWRNDIEGGFDSGQPPETAVSIMRDAQSIGYVPVIVFGWRSDDGNLHLSLPDNLVDDWSNLQAQEAFETMLVEFASEYQPPFLFLGNESDAYFITDPADYARWVLFYNRAYDAVKAVSPETLIGPIFQYERLSGQGNLNNWTSPYWGALETHDLGKIDLLGITFYPWLAYASPEEIPDNYLAPLLERIDGIPIAVTETGWPGEDLGLAAPWEQSPEAQLRYIGVLEHILSGVDLKLLNWLMLHPMARLDDNLLF